MKPVKALITIVVLALIAGAGRAETARNYRGPVGELPRGVYRPGPDVLLGAERLASRSGQVEGMTRWEFWWEANRDRFLRQALENRDRRADELGAPAVAMWEDPKDPGDLLTSDDVRVRIIPVIASRLKDPDAAMRATAALALGKAGVSEAFGPLKKLLEDGKGIDRRAAALALGFLREPLAAPALIEFVKNSGVSAAERSYGVLALGFLGASEAAPVLRDGLVGALSHRGNAMEEFQAACATALGLANDRHSIPLLLRVAKNGNGRADTVRAAATIALARIGDAACLPVLIDLTEDHEVEVRRAAVQALGLLKEEAAMPALVRAFEKDGDVQTRNFAAIAIARTGASNAGEILARGLDVKSPRALRGFSALALGLLGDRSKAELLQSLILLPSDSSLVGAASIGLALLGDSSALPQLRAIAGNAGRDDDLRGYALLAAAMLGDPITRSSLKAAARDTSSANRRRSALTALLLYPELPAAPLVLSGILEETDAFVRGAAIRALAFAPHRSVVEPLAVVAGQRGFSKDAARDAVTALGILAMRGGESPVEPFLRGVNYRSLSRAQEAIFEIL